MSIRAIILNYKNKYKDRALDEIDWFRGQPNIGSAIINAAFAMDRNGKRFSHQRRIKRNALDQAYKILISNIISIEKIKSFDDLINLVNILLKSVPGIGELYIYDASFRIGAKLGLFPKKVYLHAGTRVGAKAMGISRREKVIEPKRLPIEFQKLEPYEIEDVLCIFKRILEREKIRNLVK